MNTVLLNTVSLDSDKVIIKKGGSSGGGVTINNQDRDIEIVENGITEVTADSGYTGLGKVTVNVNVPSSGGESGGESEQIMYYGKNETDDGVASLVVYAELVKIENNILPIGALLLRYDSMDVIAQQANAVAINMSKRIVYNGQDTTFAAILAGFPQSTITKEEFYNVNA